MLQNLTFIKLMKKNKVPINIHLINAQIFIVQYTKLPSKLLGSTKALKEIEGLKLGLEETHSLKQLIDEVLSRQKNNS